MRRFVSLSAMALATLILSAGCGGKQPEVQDPADAKPKGPEASVFAPLPQATLDWRLPLVIGAEEETPCFKPVGDLAPESMDPVTREIVKGQSGAVTRAVRAWLTNKLAPSGISPTLVEKWSVEVAEPVLIEAPRERVRFTDNPSCLSKTGWLPEGRHLAVALLGGTRFAFQSSLPLGTDTQNALLEALGMENMVIESEALFVYEAAMGGDGQPMLNPEGQPLYKSPSGEFITKDKVPPPEARMMKEWFIKTEAPLWFAYRALPDDGWRKESDKDKCNVILIPEALQPQAPECAEFRDASFTVSILEGEDKPVSVTITTGKDEYKGVMLAWGDGAKVQVNDRIILWLMAKKVEVGVELFINSLVLDPKPLADGGTTADDESYAAAAAPEDPKPAAEKPAAKGGKPKKSDKAPAPEPAPAPAKKGKTSDSSALDDYLNN
jgi:hypothetical protein